MTAGAARPATDRAAVPAQVPGRRTTGMSAVLLPLHDDRTVAWDSLAAAVERTATAGLVPAVNMDTGYGPALDRTTRRRVLDLTASTLAGHQAVPGWSFVAGAHVDGPGADADRRDRRTSDDGSPLVRSYSDAAAEIADAGGVPILFPSAGLGALDEAEIAPFHASVGRSVDRLLGFELGRQFHPHGRIWSIDTYREVLDVAQVVGAKHSSLHRAPEWERLRLRDAHRPDFLVLTGNDLAIDMVRWGSDYLLGLSAFAPDAFARRDRLWADGDARAPELDDALQAIGSLAFRDPVPAYRHDAAIVWRRRGWAPSAAVMAGTPTRPDGEQALLDTLLARLDETMADSA